MVNGLHLYSAVLTSGHSKRFKVLPHIDSQLVRSSQGEAPCSGTPRHSTRRCRGSNQRPSGYQSTHSAFLSSMPPCVWGWSCSTHRSEGAEGHRLLLLLLHRQVHLGRGPGALQAGEGPGLGARWEHVGSVGLWVWNQREPGGRGFTSLWQKQGWAEMYLSNNGSQSDGLSKRSRSLCAFKILLILIFILFEKSIFYCCVDCFTFPWHHLFDSGRLQGADWS